MFIYFTLIYSCDFYGHYGDEVPKESLEEYSYLFLNKWHQLNDEIDYKPYITSVNLENYPEFITTFIKIYGKINKFFMIPMRYFYIAMEIFKIHIRRVKLKKSLL